MESSEIFQKFTNDLDAEVAWRKKETENLKLYIEEVFKSSKDYTEEKEFLLRGNIALIYAHWEGGIKNLFTFYIKYINRLLKEKIVNIDNINQNLLETIIFHKIESKLGYNNPEKRQKVINFCKKLFTNGFIKADLEMVNTKSNLKFKVYKDLVEKLGIDFGKYENKIEIESKFIDTLVKRRNHIAHGEKISELNKDFVIESIVKITNLLELNKDIIILNGQKLIEGIDNVL